MSCTEAEPFPDTAASAEHPAYLGRTRIADDHWRVLAALLVTGPEPVASWALVQVADELLPSTAGADTGPGVDAGVAAPKPGSLPIALFRSGWGDGVHPTWLGLAADGSVAVAMVDLMVLSDPCASPEEEPGVESDEPDEPDEPEAVGAPPGNGGFWSRLLGRG